MSDRVLRCDKRAETFEKKAKLLGLDLEQKCEMLSKLFNNKLEFNFKHTMWKDSGIEVIVKDASLISIELPDIEGYIQDDFITIPLDSQFRNTSQLASVRLPRSIKQIDISKAYWTRKIDRLFVYDTTRVVGTENRGGFGSSRLTVIVLSTTGGKNKIYTI